jgi:hypothetical protein
MSEQVKVPGEEQSAHPRNPLDVMRENCFLYEQVIRATSGLGFTPQKFVENSSDQRGISGISKEKQYKEHVLYCIGLLKKSIDQCNPDPTDAQKSEERRKLSSAISLHGVIVGMVFALGLRSWEHIGKDLKYGALQHPSEEPKKEDNVNNETTET